ncbi:MAG: hypothetical protein ACLSCV_07140 [Acutalibacteraceae bacterium]
MTAPYPLQFDSFSKLLTFLSERDQIERMQVRSGLSKLLSKYRTSQKENQSAMAELAQWKNGNIKMWRFNQCHVYRLPRQPCMENFMKKTILLRIPIDPLNTFTKCQKYCKDYRKARTAQEN